MSKTKKQAAKEQHLPQYVINGTRMYTECYRADFSVWHNGGNFQTTCDILEAFTVITKLSQDGVLLTKQKVKTLRVQCVTPESAKEFVKVSFP